MKGKIINAISIVIVAIAITTAYIVGFSQGISEAEPDPAPEEKGCPEYIESDSGTYWAEIYDDGRVDIHTMTEFVSNDDDGNLVVEVKP